MAGNQRGAASVPNHDLDFKRALAALWNKGETSSQIAERFGISRNAVVGLAHRNPDIFNAKGRTRARSVCATEPPPKKRLRKSRAKPKPLALVSPDPAPSVFDDLPIEPVGVGTYHAENPTRFVDRQSDQCGWIISADDVRGLAIMVCGGPVVAPLESFCAHHHARAWIKPRAPKRRGRR